MSGTALGCLSGDDDGGGGAAKLKFVNHSIFPSRFLNIYEQIHFSTAEIKKQAPFVKITKGGRGNGAFFSALLRATARACTAPVGRSLESSYDIF